MCLLGNAYQQMALEDNEEAIFAMKKENRTRIQQKYYEKRIQQKKDFKKNLLIKKQNYYHVFNLLIKQINDKQSPYALAFESFHDNIIDIFDSFLKEDEYFDLKASALQRRLDKYWGDLNDLGIIHKNKNYLKHVHFILNLADLSYENINIK